MPLESARPNVNKLADFYAALAAVSKSVQIEIDDADLAILKTSNYVLCFAKKASLNGGDDACNVVWQSLTDYLHTTILSWTPQFQLFGTKTFNDNSPVQVLSDLRTVALGEQCVLDKYGVLGPPATGGPASGITMVNNYGTIHPGLSQIATLDGTTSVTPLYVAQDAVLLGQATLTPIESVLVWFEQNVATSTMFATPRSMSVEIDLTAAASATRLYKNQLWSIP